MAVLHRERVMMVDLQPDLGEVLQEEVDGTNEEIPVSVTVEGPVRVQNLPEKAGSTKTVLIAAVPARPVRVLQADHRRSRVVLMALDGSFCFAFNAASKETPATMAWWPPGVPYIHSGDDEVWISAFTTAVNVTVIAGRWAVGEDGGS